MNNRDLLRNDFHDDYWMWLSIEKKWHEFRRDKFESAWRRRSGFFFLEILHYWVKSTKICNQYYILSVFVSADQKKKIHSLEHKNLIFFSARIDTLSSGTLNYSRWIKIMIMFSCYLDDLKIYFNICSIFCVSNLLLNFA